MYIVRCESARKAWVAALGLTVGCLIMVWSFNVNLNSGAIPAKVVVGESESETKPAFFRTPNLKKIVATTESSIGQPDYSSMRYYDVSAKQYFAEHPEFGVTESQGEEIQTTYSKLSRLRENFEAESAKVIRVSKTETFVEIPGYSDRATNWLADLQECICDTLPDSARQSEIVRVLLAKFIADNEGLGQTPSYLHVTKLAGGTPINTRFSVRRDKVSVPPGVSDAASFSRVSYAVEVAQRDVSRIGVSLKFLP